MTNTPIEQFNTFLKNNLDIKFNDQSQLQYILKIAESYLNSEVKDEELQEYIKQLYSQSKISSKLIKNLQHIKSTHQINNQKSVQKPIQLLNFSIPQQQQKKHQNLQKKEQKTVKIFDRIEQGQAKKKKIKSQYPKKEIQNDINEQIKVQQENEKKARGLKHDLQVAGKQKCRFYPYCRNMDTGDCEYYHPTQKVILIQIHP